MEVSTQRVSLLSVNKLSTILKSLLTLLFYQITPTVREYLFQKLMAASIFSSAGIIIKIRRLSLKSHIKYIKYRRKSLLFCIRFHQTVHVDICNFVFQHGI